MTQNQLGNNLSVNNFMTMCYCPRIASGKNNKERYSLSVRDKFGLMRQIKVQLKKKWDKSSRLAQ